MHEGLGGGRTHNPAIADVGASTTAKAPVTLDTGDDPSCDEDVAVTEHAGADLTNTDDDGIAAQAAVTDAGADLTNTDDDGNTIQVAVPVLKTIASTLRILSVPLFKAFLISGYR